MWLVSGDWDPWTYRLVRRTQERGRVVPAFVAEGGAIATPEGQQLRGPSLARGVPIGAPAQAVYYNGLVVWNA